MSEILDAYRQMPTKADLAELPPAVQRAVMRVKLFVWIKPVHWVLMMGLLLAALFSSLDVGAKFGAAIVWFGLWWITAETLNALSTWSYRPAIEYQEMLLAQQAAAS
jgi:hypothetical protein